MSFEKKREVEEDVEGLVLQKKWKSGALGASEALLGKGTGSVPMAAIAASTSGEVKGPTKQTTVSWASKAYANCPLVEIVHLHDCIRGGKMK